MSLCFHLCTLCTWASYLKLVISISHLFLNVFFFWCFVKKFPLFSEKYVFIHCFCIFDQKDSVASFLNISFLSSFLNLFHSSFFSSCFSLLFFVFLLDFSYLFFFISFFLFPLSLCSLCFVFSFFFLFEHMFFLDPQVLLSGCSCFFMIFCFFVSFQLLEPKKTFVLKCLIVFFFCDFELCFTSSFIPLPTRKITQMERGTQWLRNFSIFSRSTNVLAIRANNIHRKGLPCKHAMPARARHVV